jgi:small subunit ribosomal protein S17
MPNNRKRLVGRVIRNAMDKTVVVEVERVHPHRLYKKVVRTTKKHMAHDETNAIPVGALVRIVESRPISKTKRWAVETVLEMPAQEVPPATILDKADEQ